MRVAISGATGFVGRFLIEGLLEARHDIVALGRQPPAPGQFSRPVLFRQVSLDPSADQRDAFAGVNAFVHAAFDHLPGRYRGGEGSDPVGFMIRNADGSIALLEDAKAAGVRRAVFLSSRAVHDREESLYGLVKRRVEQALMGLDGANFRARSLRLTGVYGLAAPGRDHKWSQLFRDYLAGRPVEPRVGTELHGRDAATAVRLLIERGERLDPRVPAEASDLVLDRNDLLAIVRQLTDVSFPLPPTADTGGLHVMDASALRALGWQPGGQPLLRETVQRMLACL